jgi:hypothetical protein
MINYKIYLKPIMLNSLRNQVFDCYALKMTDISGSILPSMWLYDEKPGFLSPLHPIKHNRSEISQVFLPVHYKAP